MFEVMNVCVQTCFQNQHPEVSHLGHPEVYLEGQVSYGTPLDVCLATLTSYQNVLSSSIFHNVLLKSCSA